MINFDSPFPKQNKKLTNILGNQLILKRKYDTLYLKISSDKNFNCVINSKTGDTTFYGTVCKFRGLYYFSEKTYDDLYYINAVKISDGLIYGFGEGWYQMQDLAHEIQRGEYRKLVSFINSDSVRDEIRLHPDKHEMKLYYSSRISQTIPDTILIVKNNSLRTVDTSNMMTYVDPEENVILSRVYPNPTTDIINIELQQKDNVSFQLTNINGKTIQQGQFSKTSNQLDIKNQPTGIYILTLLNATDNQKENIKIIKTE